MDPSTLKSGGGDPSSQHKNCPKMDESLRAKAFIASFLKAKKDILLYPAGNPVIAQSIEQYLQTMKDLFAETEPVELLVEKDRLIVNGEEIGTKNPGVEGLSLSLYRRGVRKLFIDPNIPFEEISALFETINMKTEDIAEAGGLIALIKQKRMNHVLVEETAELSVVDKDGIAVAEDLLPELEGLEGLDMRFEQLSVPEKFCSVFVRVKDGDLASMKRLRTLLGNPNLFSKLLERFSIQIEKVEGRVDPLARVGRLLEILRTMGMAIASLPSEDERSKLLGNLAISVLGLTVDLRSELVSQGLIPNLALRAIESSILGRFPVSRLADALLNDFAMSGATVSVMQSYFSNLDFSHLSRSTLVRVLRGRLEQRNMLSPEVEAALKAEESRPRTEKKISVVTAATEMPVPEVEGYPLDKVFFAEGERERLTSQLQEAFEAPAPNLMVHAILELLHYEEAPANHAMMVERAQSYMDYFLEHRDYENATRLIMGLRAEMEQKRRPFSESQLRPLRKVIDEYVGDERIQQLIGTFKDLNRGSPEFDESIRYLKILGEHATKVLLHALEYQKSRHVRLLICHALVQVGEKDIGVIGEHVSHPTWFVARNAVSILGQIGKPECIPYLEKALSHEDIRIRKEALKGLASMKIDRAIELVCSCAQGQDPEMRKAALGWAAALGMEPILPTIDKLLGNAELWKQDDEVIRLAIEALGNMGSESAKDKLRKLAQVRSLFRWRKSALIRKSALAALNSVDRGQLQ